MKYDHERFTQKTSSIHPILQLTLWRNHLGIGRQLSMPVRLEQNAMCRTQQAPAHATAECRMHHCPLCRPGRKKELDEYFAGKRHTFEIPLHPVGTDFQKQVWQALLEIPYGETRTYKEIAQKTNKLKGIRAVAQAIGANGISILIPCHRVIGTNRSLTGYAGGIEAKRLLLNIECQNTPYG